MLISFTLSMPNRSSYNGRWGGEDRIYCIIKNIRSKKWAERILKESSYYYNFGDGWGASVSVEAIDAAQSRKLRKKSNGFSGYDWMVRSILMDGEINTNH